MLLCALLLNAAQAGPWVKDPGHAYVKAGFVRFAADEYVDPTDPQGATAAQAGETPEYVGNTWHLYGEVGLLKPVQLVFNLPYVASRNRYGETLYANRALGDAEVGLAAGHSLGDWPISLTVVAKLPLYDNGQLLDYGYLGARFPSIGDGQVDLTAMAAVGRGFRAGAFQGWAAAEVGYRHRTEWWLGDSSKPDRELLDGIPWRLQLGWSPRKGDRDLGWLSVDGSGVQRLASNATTKQWVQLGLGGGVTVVEGFSAELGGSITPVAQASSTGWALSAGVSWKR